MYQFERSEKMKATNSNWSDYLYFLKIAEFRSLQQAAIALDVNSSTVYRRLNALEERLNVKLFERSRSQQGYDITIAGEEILKKIRAVEEVFIDIEEHFIREDSRISGHINIGVSDGIGEFWLYKYVSVFKDLYPKVDIEFITISRDGRLNHKKEADFSFVISQKTPEYMESIRIKNIFLYLCATKQLIDKYKLFENIEENLEKNIDLVMPSDALKQLDAVRWLHSCRNDSYFNFKADNFLSLYYYCIQGLGATILPDYMIDNTCLEKINPSSKSFSVFLWLVSDPQDRLTAISRIFIKFLIQQLLLKK